MDKIMPSKQVQADFVVSQPSKLSFKGSFTYLEVAEKFGEDFGEAARKHFKEIIEKASTTENSGLKIHNNLNINLERPSYRERALSLLIYPVTKMPLDFANAVISTLKKIPGLKNTSWLDKLANKSALKNRREFLETQSNVAAVQHYFQLLTDAGGDDYKRFAEGHKRLAPLMPNYNSETERSVTRLVTGLIPAFFLANDAYNLSIYLNNDKELAKKEKKRRFNQELFRIGVTTALTFGILNLFTKHSNKSLTVAAGLISGMTLISEVIGRYLAGNPVLPVTAKGAKKYADKRKELNQPKNPEPALQEPAENKTDKKGFLTIGNALKVLAGLVVFGFAAEKVSKMPTITKKWGEFHDWYKKLYTDDFIISRDKFDDITQKLRDNHFDKIANKYDFLIEEENGANIKIGSTKNRTKYVLIHQILAFPVRFIRKIVMLPYEGVVKTLIRIIKKEAKEEKEIDSNKLLQNSIKFLEKIKGDSPEDFTKKVNQSLISSLDDLTKSNYSNADLGTVTKIATSAITSGFLIADNYNMVMIDSQGKDRDLAGEKAKERTMQRVARLTYEAFLLKMITDIFAGAYNSSLWGAQAINGGLRVVTEVLERKAVGLPLHEATQEEIKENKKEHLEATGLKGAYFRTMAKITGKQSLSENKKKY